MNLHVLIPLGMFASLMAVLALCPNIEESGVTYKATFWVRVFFGACALMALTPVLRLP